MKKVHIDRVIRSSWKQERVAPIHLTCPHNRGLNIKDSYFDTHYKEQRPFCRGLTIVTSSIFDILLTNILTLTTAGPSKYQAKSRINNGVKSKLCPNLSNLIILAPIHVDYFWKLQFCVMNSPCSLKQFS